ncbi:MAG: ABC transporter permease [Myxococcota bacterium]|jgi:putative ABC transport system permease protein|nr:ABC transporter permease [Myxococcota bacterium]
MSLLQVLRVAVLAILRNAMRSFLTVLGIIIGVAAVITMVALGEGAQAQVSARFSAMGADLLVLRSGSTRQGGVRGGAGSSLSLSWDDLEAIRTQVPSAQYVAPLLRLNAQVLSEEQNWACSINGTSPEYFDIQEWKLGAGEPFSEVHLSAGAQVAVLGATVADQLFGYQVDPVQQSIRIRNVPFTVLGVLQEKGQSAMGQNADDVVLIPYTTFNKRLERRSQQFVAGEIYVKAVAGKSSECSRAITMLLRERHQLQPGEEDDFSVRDLAEIASARQEGVQTFSLLLASIAAVSLLVGGIGIMNIMLVSVTERTREIGLRMAVGARPVDILSQFLIESMVLSLTGGILGVGLGFFASQRLAEQFQWAMPINPDIIGVAMGFSALVGIVFGIYPAWKASRLDPIEALRHE